MSKKGKNQGVPAGQQRRRAAAEKTEKRGVIREPPTDELPRELRRGKEILGIQVPVNEDSK